MTRAPILIFSLLLTAACGDLQETAPRKSEPANNGGTNNGATNNGATNNGAVDPDAWEEWGTRGARNMGSNSAAGFAKCDLDDVRSDDLNQQLSTEVPEDGWNDIRPDSAARCGDDFETLTWRLHNCERITRELSPLRCDLRVVWVSRQHTNDMVARGFFDHVNPDGESPFDRFEARGISFSSAGENLAGQSTILEAHYRWMDSQAHRTNILGDYEFAGVGSARVDGGFLLTTGFYR